MKDKVSLATLTLAKAYTDEQGGGGGGTSNYNDLTHKPTVNGVEFKGTMTGETLGLVDAEDGKGLSTNDYTDADKSIVGGVTSALAGKVDKVSGKGLSTNDYDDSAKAIVDGVTTALEGKVDKHSTDSLMTAEEHTKLNGIASGAEVNVQSDWNQTTSSADDFIKNKPDLTVKANKTETYLTTDSAETSLTDNDKFPFYDISVTATKHSTWSNIKSKLKTYFDTLYAAVSSVYTKTEADNLLDDKFTYEDNAILGAKNLLNNTATTQTINGVTYTVNADKTVSLSNTATANARLTVGSFTAKAGETYILTGAPNSADTSNYLGLYLHGETQTVATDTGNGVVIATDTDTLYDIGIRIKSGKDTSGMVFKPMIRLSTDPDDTYVPYAMTNRELTLALDGKLDKIDSVYEVPSGPIIEDELYPSEEQVVGKYGNKGQEKTLYMRTLTSLGNITFNVEGSEVVIAEPHNIANIDEIVFAQFTCKPTSANIWSPLPHKKKYVEIDRTYVTGYTSNSRDEEAAIKGLIYYTKTS